MRYHLTSNGLQDLTLSPTKLLYSLFIGESTSDILNLEAVMARLFDHSNIVFKLASTRFQTLTMGERSLSLQQNMMYLEQGANELRDGSGIVLYSIQMTGSTRCFFGNYVQIDPGFYGSLVRKKLLDEILPTL